MIKHLFTYLLGGRNMKKKLISLCLIAVIMIAQVHNVVIAMEYTSKRTYELEVGLWHATKDSASMAKDALTGTATLVVENGTYKIYVDTKEAVIMGFVGYIESMQVEETDGSYTDATIEAQDDTARPTQFSFETTEVTEYYPIKASIITTLMPMTQSARIKLLNLDEVLEQIEIDEAEAKGDLSKVVNGTYEVNVNLWHETSDKESMAASSVKAIARIAIRDRVATMYLYTQPMSFGSLVASLQELKIQMQDGSYQNAVVEMTSEDGNPIGFSFVVPSFEEYLQVLVNPKVAMMGNMDIGARLRVDYSSVTKIEDDTDMKQDPNPIVLPEVSPSPETSQEPTIKPTTQPTTQPTQAPIEDGKNENATGNTSPAPTVSPTVSPTASTTPTVQGSSSTTNSQSSTSTNSTTSNETTTTVEDTTTNGMTNQTDQLEENNIEENSTEENSTQENNTQQNSTQVEYTITYKRSLGTIVLNIMAGISLVTLFGIYVWDRKGTKGR